MTQVTKFWPLLTAMHRYDKSLSTRNIDIGIMMDAPILAYLIETKNGRILFDVGCDYTKINNPKLVSTYYEEKIFAAPTMQEEQRLPHHFERLGISAADIDVVFLSHLHFDHAGGLCDVCGVMHTPEVHVQQDELAFAQSGQDMAYFSDEVIAKPYWKIQQGEYSLTNGVEAITTPGHTAGHMSLFIELPKGPPIILAGDAADLQQNIIEEIAPGLCWQDNSQLAIDSIRKLKKLAAQENAMLWPNHDISFFQSQKRFPDYHE